MTHSRPTVRRVISEVGELELADEPEERVLEDALEEMPDEVLEVALEDAPENEEEEVELVLLLEAELGVHPH